MLTKSKKTANMPLMMNFTTPEEAPIVKAEDYYVYYDHKLRISYHLGGGNGNSRNTTSQKGYKRTDDRGRYSGGDYNGTVYTHNDAPVMTDD